MLGTFSFALLGFLLGMRHAVDPDHVLAVTTIASTEPSLRRASRIGVAWGIGHTVTILLVGGAIILFRIAISPRVGLALEFVVALMLVALGLASMLGRGVRPTHPHDHSVRPLVVGMVHGLAGSAAVALLALAAVEDPGLGMAYLLLFGVGTIIGMMLVTTLVALPAMVAATRMDRARRWIGVAAGAASLAFGIFLATRIGFVDGLFTSTPVWEPK